MSLGIRRPPDYQKLETVALRARIFHKFDTCRMASIAAVKFSSEGARTWFVLCRGETRRVSSWWRRWRSFLGYIFWNHTRTCPRTRQTSPEVLDDFFDFIGDQTNTMVAHNTKFDENVVLSEMYRHNLDLSRFKRLDFQCTLKMYKDRFLKPIKLTKLYMELFNKEFSDAQLARGRQGVW